MKLCKYSKMYSGKIQQHVTYDLIYNSFVDIILSTVKFDK